ncbi:fumarylacetoacetase [Nocardioides sp. 616]|uniref:fumarylacetoacetase n=1 Tax=Nocardioides sp. 616 TaxID=2268090 RepID=UPI000CE3CD01|nr:fumarylacetoacetase [Nocardioides sp. 616]
MSEQGLADSGFGPDHLPYGVFSATPDGPRRIGVRLHQEVLDLAGLTQSIGDTRVADLWRSATLNPFLALGRQAWDDARSWLTGLLADERAGDLVARHSQPLAEVVLHLPFAVTDYVDFYASEHHAANVGRILRPDTAPLLPNYKHLPVAYHGRAGTVVVSGTEIVRPLGQRAPEPSSGPAQPVFGPTERLDLEAEVGFVVGLGTALGERIATADLAEHVFGVVGLNDWSARDIQAWEYVPLGPFLGKSFATSVSAWVTPLAALDAAWTDLPRQDPTPLPYLAPGTTRGLAIEVEVVVNGHVVSRPSYADMYWSPAQMLAHLTVNGASVSPGDLFGSGTVSGPEAGQRGSLLELTWGWREPVALGAEQRTALLDGDEVVLRYSAPGTGGGRISLGEVAGRVAPARAWTDGPPAEAGRR